MIKFLASVLVLIVLCEAQSPPEPVVPVIQEIHNLPEGIFVQWQVQSSLFIIGQRVKYMDSIGRHRELSVSVAFNVALLRFVRPCEHYTVRVTVIYQNGEQRTSDPKEITRTAVEIPPIPTGLKITEHVTGFELSWDAMPTSIPITKLNIIGREDNGEVVRQFAMYDQTKAVLSSFHLNHNYNVTMSSENSCGVSNESKPVRLEAINVPGTPVILETVPTINAITVYFQKSAPEERVDAFYVNYTSPNSTMSLPALPANSTMVTLTEGIETCVKYDISLWAHNAAGSSNPTHSLAFAYSLDVPLAPTDVTVEELDGQVQISWNRTSTEPLQGYIFAYANTQNDQTETEYVEGDVTEAKLQQIKRCQSYRLKIRGEGRCGWSAWSDEITFKLGPDAKPTRPTNVMTSGNADQLWIKWTRAQPQEQLEYYDLLLINFSNTTVTYWIPPTASEFTLRGLNPRSTYALSLEAKNGCGWSEPNDFLLELQADGTVRPLAVTARVRELLKRARRSARAAV